MPPRASTGEKLIRLRADITGVALATRRNRITNADLPIGEDVGVEPAAVDQVLDDPGPRQLLQMQARLAQLDARALNVPDPETPAHQLVKPHSPHNHLTARLRTGQSHVLERLGLDQRQCLARLCAILIEVPVAAQPFTCDRGSRRDRLERLAQADIDLLDIHEPIMPSGAAPSNPITGRRVRSVSDDREAIESTAHAAVGALGLADAASRRSVEA